MRLLTCAVLASLAAAGPARAAEDAAPPAFLTQIDGAQALAWVHDQNARTLATLQGDPRYAPLFDQALRLAEAKDRIPAPAMLAGGITNFWQDERHVRGVWRRATLDSYRTASPDWSVLLDLDALAAAEHANWVWRDPVCAEPAERTCLVSLSDGGEDAVSEREFDLAAGRFVAGGFDLPKGKQDVAWLDDDTLLAARDWGAGTLTRSGYAFVVKRLARGQRLDQAVEVYRGEPGDEQVIPSVLVDGDGHRLVLITRAVSFFQYEYRVLTPGGLVRLDLPGKSSVAGLVAGRLVVKLEQAFATKAGTIPAGSLISLDASHLDAPPQVVFTPGPTQSLDMVAVSRSRVVATLFDNVRGQVRLFAPVASGWQGSRLALPDDVSVEIADANTHDDHVFLDVAGFLDPTQLWLADAAAGTAAVVKSLPAKFDASPYVVDQNQAASSDGTEIPYFVVHRRDMRLDGRNPTQLYAYGGFQVSMTPSYSGALGRLWLDRGGVYVLANIRGGGEFRPAWHEAGLQTKRQLVFDDFAAVARDLIARRITAPDRLGIRGGSNGGLLMGVEMTQHPELWAAAVIEVPLLDMLNYETMSAGASWVDEYGSVSVPAQRAFLAGISPLQNLRAGVAYPEPFVFTTTRDDRVGPVHARRFAWRMAALGLPFLYFEQTEGGHAAGANLREKAEEQALEYTYLARKLMP